MVIQDKAGSQTITANNVIEEVNKWARLPREGKTEHIVFIMASCNIATKLEAKIEASTNGYLIFKENQAIYDTKDELNEPYRVPTKMTVIVLGSIWMAHLLTKQNYDILKLEREQRNHLFKQLASTILSSKIG